MLMINFEKNFYVMLFLRGHHSATPTYFVVFALEVHNLENLELITKFTFNFDSFNTRVNWPSITF